MLRFTLRFWKSLFDQNKSSFLDFAQTISQIEKTPSIKQKNAILERHYNSLNKYDQKAVRSIFKFIHEKPKTGIAEKTLIKYLVQEHSIEKDVQNLDDLVQQMQFQQSEDYKDQIFKISCYLDSLQETGTGSTTEKLKSIRKFLLYMKPIEGLVFLKIITKNLRIGLKSKAMKLEQKKSFELMLSKPLKTLSDVEEFCAKKTSNILADLKYDGERTLLIYEKGAGIELISRRNKPQTDIYKKLVSDLNNQLSEKEEIESIKIDGEIVCVDQLDEPLPLQILISQRGKEENKTTQKQKIFAFDVLELNGEQLYSKPLIQRRKLIPESEILKKSKAQEFSFSSEKSKLVQYYLQVIRSKHEGLILKGVSDLYYTNGTRKHWGKMKKGCRIKQTDTGKIDLDLIVMGVDYGQGKKSHIFATFLLGVMHEGLIYPISRVGSGFKDEQLENLTKQLQKYIIKKSHELYQLPKSLKVSRYLNPAYVFEISCQDLTRSPLYNFSYKQDYGGISLRFPVFERIRNDKGIEDCKSDYLLQLSKAV